LYTISKEDDVFIPREITIKGCQLLDLRGEGDYGAVFHARQLAIDRQVAVKTVECSQ
jgi:hypothetical protein